MALIKNMTVCVAGVAAMRNDSVPTGSLYKKRSQRKALSAKANKREYSDFRVENREGLQKGREILAKKALEKLCEELKEKAEKNSEDIKAEDDLKALMECQNREVAGIDKKMIVKVLKNDTFNTEYEQSFYNTLRITTNYIAKEMNEKAEKMKFKIVNDKFEVRFVVDGKEEKEPRTLNISGTFASKFEELFGDRATVELGNIDVVNVISCAKGKKMKITFDKKENKYTSKPTKMAEDDKCDDL